MLSLYRRHRPRSFDEVVGQESVVRTLRNAIELGKVHHAYLFVGSRGTGKTSMAKLLACALNAPGGPSADFAPDEESCRAIMAGTSLDVVEMDAASNNSVDDIRELRENVALSPMGGARRVYILDEAHMLSPQAWNAFLKTLEEPPAHVVFVLATTEAHKIPATIIDRCHRFDFQRPSLEQIAGVLRRVAEVEEIKVPDAAVGMIARKAAGSFRDALGTLEQLVTYGGSAIDIEEVREALGVADAALILDTTEAFAECEPRAALLAVARLAESGRDYDQFVRDLAGHLRHLLVVQTLGEVPDSYAVTAEHTDRLASQAERLDQGDLLRAIDLLADAIAAVKDGSEPRLQLEVALLKATQPRADQSLQALMRRLDTLEARLGERASGSGATPGAAVPPAPHEAGPPQQPDRPRASEPARQPSGAAREAGQARATVAVAASVSTSTGDQGSGAEQQVARGSAAAVAVLAAPEAQLERAPDTVVHCAPAPDLDRVKALWSGVADAVREQNAMVAALIADAVPSALEGSRLTVAFPADAAFSKRKAESNRDLVLAALRSLTGSALSITFELSDGEQELPATRMLGAEDLIDALRREFGAEEVLLEAAPDDSSPDTED
jgi:DNA polymerase-3 subunit gamma/tau